MQNWNAVTPARANSHDKPAIAVERMPVPHDRPAISKHQIEEPRSKLRGMFCRAAEPRGNTLAIAVQLR
jgi:hypothetical protein